MGIREDEKNRGTWMAWFCKRHPITRVPHSLKRIGLKSKSEARRVEAELVVKIEDKIRRKTLPTWEQATHEFIQAKKLEGMSTKSLDSYLLCLKAHTFPKWGSRLIDEINGNDIREIIIERVGSKSQSHQKNLLKFIRGVFIYAQEKCYIGLNPTPKMKFRIGDKIKSVLTLEQVKIFLTQAKIIGAEWYPIWAMALYTGMRNGELYALTWDKVDLDAGRILVDCSWNNDDGFKDTKSGDDRIVQIAPELSLILKELKLRGFDSNFVLPRIDKWDKGEQARELRMFLEGLGLPRIRFHDLRATWATIMLSMGIAPIKVMSMGGWKDLKTMQFYIRKAGVDTTGICENFNLHNPEIGTIHKLHLNIEN